MTFYVESLLTSYKKYVKGRSRRLRPKAHILDDPLGNPYDVLSPFMATLWPKGSYKGPLWPYEPPQKVVKFLLKKGAFLLKKGALAIFSGVG